MNRFDRDTHLEELERGRFRVRIDPGWWITHGPNGGYVTAILLRGVQQIAADASKAPRTLTVHFLSPLLEGPAELEVEVDRNGRTLTVLSARLHQEGRVCALARAILSTARPKVDCELEATPMPEVPGPEILDRDVRFGVPMHRRMETRFIPGLESFSTREEAVVAAWLRLDEPRPLDAPLLALYADGIPPAVFGLLSGDRPLGVPTAELTIHFHLDREMAAPSDDEFVLVRASARTVRNSFVTEDAEVWSRDGWLLAHARQTAILVES